MFNSLWQADSKKDEALATVQQKLSGLDKALESPESLMRDVGDIVMGAIAATYDSQSEPDGTAWAPLAAATLKAKARKGYSGKINIASGKTRASFKIHLTRNSVEVGTDSAIALYNNQTVPRSRAGRRSAGMRSSSPRRLMPNREEADEVNGIVGAKIAAAAEEFLKSLI